MQTISVSTTQNVSIQYPLASVGERILAYFIDRLIMVIFAIISVFAVYNLAQTAVWAYIMVIVLPLLLYSLVFEIVMKGQTPGKKAMNIQVIKLDGTEPGFGEYVLRWIFSIVDFGFFGGIIAFLLIIIGGKGQRLGDVVAGTTVVKLIQQKEISSEEIFITPETNYEPMFPQASQLNARDLEIIQKAIDANSNFGNEKPLPRAAEKVKEILGVQSNMPPREFLYLIVKDYHHLNSI